MEIDIKKPTDKDLKAKGVLILAHMGKRNIPF